MEKIDRVRLQIANDERDPEKLEQISRASATQHYRAWIRHLRQTARLLADFREIITKKTGEGVSSALEKGNDGRNPNS
jgi:hypothetical protein